MLVVGLGCVALVALALVCVIKVIKATFRFQLPQVIASICCLCRHRLRHLASTCSVAARLHFVILCFGRSQVQPLSNLQSFVSFVFVCTLAFRKNIFEFCVFVALSCLVLL